MKKDILLVILILICVGLAAVLIHILEKDSKVNKSLDEERYSRMVAEESLQKNAGKLATFEAQLKQATNKMSLLQGQMDEEKNANNDLQKQYDDLSKVKADLESKLKAISENTAQVTPTVTP